MHADSVAICVLEAPNAAAKRKGAHRVKKDETRKRLAADITASHSHQRKKEKIMHQKYNCKRGVEEHEPITKPHGQEGYYYVVATLRACIHRYQATGELPLIKASIATLGTRS